jgi:hypothetical protein
MQKALQLRRFFVVPLLSLPGLTRQPPSCEERWIRGSSPRVTCNHFFSAFFSAPAFARSVDVLLAVSGPLSNQR